jgi:hypothetical protein
VLIYRFEKLADDKRHGLDAFDLFLSTNKFAFEIQLLVFDVTFLYLEKFQMACQFLVLDIKVLLLQLLVESGLF